jgi:hypothetical protein
MKHIFHPKALHLGHVAKAFGLAKPPATMGKQYAAITRKDDTNTSTHQVRKTPSTTERELR